MAFHASGKAALITALCFSLCGWVGPSAAESWMNERQRAASARRDLDRLADQARRPNTPGNRMVLDPEALCRTLGSQPCKIHFHC